MRALPPQLEGVKVFPCMPGGKLPATKHGWHVASNDPAQIAEWLKINPDWNWAVATGPSGLFVIDVDPNGLDWWANLLERDATIKAAVDRAFQVRTPRGGIHVYFKGEGPSTASRIAEGIDTRGGFMRQGKLVSGGYVLLPGSRTDAGTYSELHGGVIEPLPAAVAAIIPERKKTDTLGLTRNPDMDQPRNVAWARDLLNGYVQSGRVAIEGRGGDNLTFQVCASILDKAISPAMAYDLISELWNPHCSPPWDEWELETKIRNAAEHGEDTAGGVKGFQSNADAFANFAGMEIPELTAPKPERSARNKLMFIHDYADSVNDPEWLIPGLIPANGTGMIYGVSGSYKSFVALDMALCLAFGIAGQWGAAPEKHDVLYFAGEGSIATARKRWPAWMEYHNIEFRADHRFIIKDRVPFFTDTDEWEAIKQDLAELKAKPALIVIDTLARLATGLDENSTKDASLITNFAEQLARYYECFVLLIHHEGKDSTKGARGSSVFYANMDTAINTKTVTGGTQLKVKKQKDADVNDELTYLKVTPSGASIVLVKSNEAPSADEGDKRSKYSWANVDEVVAVLKDFPAGTTTEVLAQTIAGLYGLEKDLVKKQLNYNNALAFLRPSRGNWCLPSTEYDL